ncbi:hypothetical protein BDY21DRAFT_352205 [Lineolata rhizophorae]|uniref:Uncharacterized protein n=1 Tax=Lineolata rhizophorae TaxID=578093 RepID=A0A6A6NT29_9PEZI|nr:hypothetical protein BDY21DRAFT_352205 [Lineolata rhizophorae]
MARLRDVNITAFFKPADCDDRKPVPGARASAQRSTQTSSRTPPARSDRRLDAKKPRKRQLASVDAHQPPLKRPSPSPSPHRPPKATPAQSTMQTRAQSARDTSADVATSSNQLRSDAANQSFSSLASLSQTTTTSRRIIKNGHEIVRTSDTEDDSDSSLEDLSALIAGNNRKKPPNPQSTFTPPSRSVGDGGRDMNRNYRFRSSASDLFPKSRTKAPRVFQKPNYSFTLDQLVDVAGKNAERDKRVAEQRKLLEASSETGTNGATSDVGSDLEDEEGRAHQQKLRLAVERTVTRETQVVCNLFGETPQEKARNPFPKDALPKDGWTALLQGEKTRDQAFLSGFVATMNTVHHLPVEVLLWILDDILLQPREDLNYAYSALLETSWKRLRPLLDRNLLQSMLRTLGCLEDAYDLEKQVPHSFQEPNSPKPSAPPGLARFLQLLCKLGGIMLDDAREYAIAVLLRLSLDNSVRSSALILGCLQDALLELITGISASVADPTLSRLARQLYSALAISSSADAKSKNALSILQYWLVSTIPATHPLTHKFRRHMAMCSFLGSSSRAIPDYIEAKYFEYILVSLSKDEQYTPTRTTDYAALGARMSLLDVAIDIGFRPMHFEDLLCPDEVVPASDAAGEGGKSSKQKPRSKLFQKRGAPAKPKRPAAEAAFNAAVAAVAHRIAWIGERIIEGGSGHMPRVEAKQIISRLQFRLEHAVSTERRRRRGVLDVVEFGEDSDGDKPGLKTWLVRPDGAKESADGTPAETEHNGVGPIDSEGFG